MAAAVHWTALFLLVIVWTEHVSDAVTPALLSSVVNNLKRSYQPAGMFSMAVRVPDMPNKNAKQLLDIVIKEDVPATVLDRVRNGHVYYGKWLVEAVRIMGPPTVHAEARVVGYLHHLFEQRNNVADWLIFYSYASPCDERCTNRQDPANILTSINQMNKWPTRFFVFSTIFQPRNGPQIPVQSLTESLQRLAGVIGKETIYRCYSGTCTPCFSGNQVSNICVSG